jgi:membrane protease YdiL (CAAX protease family)
LSSRARTCWVIAFALVFPTLITWLYFVALKGASPGVQQAAYGVGKVVQFGLPVGWVFFWDRKRARGTLPAATGERTPHRSLRGIGWGLAFGLLIGSAMFLVYFAWLKPAGFFDGPAEQVIAKVTGMGLNTTVRYGAVSVFYALGHSFLEEYYWRWFVYRELRGVSSISIAVWISSLGFMAHHVLVLATYFGWGSPATWLFSISVAIGGAVWAWLYERSQTLLGPWASHCLVDAAIFFLGYDLVRLTLQ